MSKGIEGEFPVFRRSSGGFAESEVRVYRLDSNRALITLQRTKYAYGRTEFNLEMGEVAEDRMREWIEPRGWEHCDAALFYELMAEFRSLVEKLPQAEAG